MIAHADDGTILGGLGIGSGPPSCGSRAGQGGVRFAQVLFASLGSNSAFGALTFATPPAPRPRQPWRQQFLRDSLAAWKTRIFVDPPQ